MDDAKAKALKAFGPGSRAHREGWQIVDIDGVVSLQPVAPVSPPTELMTPGLMSDDIGEMIVARAWAMSAYHREALEVLSLHAPESAAALQIDELKNAAAALRREEDVRYKEIKGALEAVLAENPALKMEAAQALNALYLDMHNRRIDAGYRPKSFEAHHEHEVARESFLIALHDSMDPAVALEKTRQRMLISVTPHELYLRITPARQQEPDRDPGIA